MSWLAPLLEKNGEIAVFLAIGLGYWIGKFKFKGVGFGPVTGSLLAGVLIGNVAHVPVSDTAKQILFLMFMYGIGYSAGPGFIRGIRDGGWRWVAVGFAVPLTGLLTAFVMARLLHLQLGYAAGMMSGGLSESPIIGTASEAIRSLALSDEEKSRLVSQIPVADALTYIFGTFGVIFFCSYIGPWLLRLDLQAHALGLEKEMGFVRQKAGVESALHMHELRAYRLEASMPVVGKTIRHVESSIAHERVFIERVRREGRIIDVAPDLVLRDGDVVLLIGRQETLVNLVGERADEVFDRELLDVPSATYDVVLTSKEVKGQTLNELRDDVGLRGLFLKAIHRNGQSIPIAPATKLYRGDTLTLYGLEPAVQRAALRAGTVLQLTSRSDYVACALAIAVGALLGLVLAFPAGGLHIALGTSVATLVVGLAMGWRNSVRPSFAMLAPDAIDLMTSIGLAGFVAMIGLKAGPIFVEAMKEIGLAVFLGGVVVTLVPQFVGLLVGRYVLRLDPLLLLGALAGAQTMTAGLAAVQERSGSPIAVIGYSSTVAFGHILLSMSGTALIWLLHAA